MPPDRQDPDQYASELIEETETLLAEWEARVRDKVIDNPEGISSHILRNNLAYLIESIARTISNPHAKIQSKVINVAHDHANERLKLTDFSLSNILDEYSIFREVLLEHLQRPQPLSWELQQRIHRAIDNSIREATRFFLDRRTEVEEEYRVEREQLMDRLRASNRRLEAVLDQMPVGVTLAERPDGKIIYANRAASDILGHDVRAAEDNSRYDQANALHLDLSPYSAGEYPLARAVLDSERIDNEEMLYRRGDGRIINLSMHAAPVRVSEDGGDLAVAMFYDTTTVKETQAALAREQEFAQVTLEAMGDGVITTDREGRVERMNPAAERLTGWPRPRARSTAITEVVRLLEEDAETPIQLPIDACLTQNRQSHSQSVFMLEHSNGGSTPVTYNLAPIHGLAGEVIGSVTILRDASLQWRRLQEFAHEARHDALTGLANRREFERRLRQVKDQVEESGERATLLYFDLDRFKIINDSCGHTAGDALLVQLASLLKEHTRDRDTLARVGGDEFAVILDSCPLDTALEIANSLRETVREFVFQWDGASFHIGVSIGLLEIRDANASVHDLVQQADEACYSAKQSGRNRVQVAEPPGSGTKPARPRTNWAALVSEAIAEDRLQLFGQTVQPLAVTPEKRRSLEFVVRMPDTEGNIVRPAAFMPAAERHNLMPELDYWVAEHALAWLRTRGLDADRYWLYTIKVSAYTLSDDAATRRLMNLLKRPGVDPGLICLEITEFAGTQNLREAAHFISALKRLGYRVSLEDVGGGTASFRHLKRLAVDFLKIDGAFIQGMKDDESNVALVRSINEVGHILGKKTIAKLVDSEETLDQLKAIGVDYAQGYYNGPPQPLDALWAAQDDTASDLSPS